MAAFNTTTPIQDRAGEILDNCFTSFCGSSRQVYIKEKPTQKECSRITKRLHPRTKVAGFFAQRDKYRFYPTREQEKTSYSDTSFLLTLLKHQEEYQWLKDVSSVPLQQSLRHLQSAFNHFFAGRTKFPRFKKKVSRQSATFASTAFRFDGENLKLAKHKRPLKIKWSRRFSGKPTTVTVSKEPSGRYFVSMLVKEDAQYKPFVTSKIGLDLGIKDFAITSNGIKYANPKNTIKYEKKLELLQRRLSRKTKGSNNRIKSHLIEISTLRKIF